MPMAPFAHATVADHNGAGQWNQKLDNISARVHIPGEDRKGGLGVSAKEKKRVGPLGWPALNIGLAKADV